MLRRPFSAIALFCLMVLPAAPAHAQGQVVFDGCTPERNMVTSVGPQLGNREKGSITNEVMLQCDDLSIFADHVTWDGKVATASGRLLVVQKGFRVTAARAEFNRETRLGVFYDAFGTARISDQPGEPGLSAALEPEVMFQAERLEKTGPQTYKITNGWFSTCVQPNPRWSINGSSGTVTLDKHVMLKNSVLRVKGIPVVYIPFIYYPISEKDRSTGLLTPVYTTSTVKGQGISNAYFLALGRWHDATFYHDYFSKTGHGLGGEYRFASAAGRGDATFYWVNERAQFNPDGSLSRDASRWYELRGSTTQQLPKGVQLIGRVNYSNNTIRQQLYQQNLYDFSRRDRLVLASLSKDWRVNRTGFRLSGGYERRDVYTGLETAQRSGRAPEVRFSMFDRVLDTDNPGSFLSRVSIGGNAEFVNFRNQLDINDALTDRGVWRIDGAPTVRATLTSSTYLSLTTTGSLRLTRWSNSLDPVTGEQISLAMNRSLIDLSATMRGPSFERIWRTPTNGYAERFTHQIVPEVTVQWLSAFDRFNEVVRNDHVDQQVGGTTTVNYALTNLLTARVKQGGSSTPRTILAVRLSQSYYSNALAGLFDTRYQGASQGSFSAILLRATASPTDRASGRFDMYIDSKTRAIQSYSASGSLNLRLGELGGGWRRRRFLADVPGFDNPAFATNFFDANVSLRSPGGRLGGSYALNYDLKSRSFVQQRIVAFYNAQCCGVSVDYQTIELGHLGITGLQQDRRFGFSFTLAGLGSFSNPMGAFGNNTERR